MSFFNRTEKIFNYMSDIRLITCVGVEHDLALLPHFIDYYQGLGISSDKMHIVLQASEENTRDMEKAQDVLDDFGIKAQEIWIAAYTSDSMWEKRREIQKLVAKPMDWVISADVDEFHEFPTNVSDFLNYCEGKGVNCVQGVFIDRLAPNGQLNSVEAAPSIWEQFPVEADVICTIRQNEKDGWVNGTVNIMACKGHIFPSRGGHGPMVDKIKPKYPLGRRLGLVPGIEKPEIRFSCPLKVHHFKWTDSLLNSLKKRLLTPGVSERGKSYGELLLKHIEKEGKIQLEKIPVKNESLFNKVPWKAQIMVLKLRNPLIGVMNRIKRMVN